MTRPIKSRVRKVKAWAVLDAEGNLLLWGEGRYPIYKSTRGEGIDSQRAKFPKRDFVVKPCTITYSLPITKKRKAK